MTMRPGNLSTLCHVRASNYWVPAQLWKNYHSEESKNVELSSSEHFFCGLAAGIISKTVCHPLDVVKKRFQVWYL